MEWMYKNYGEKNDARFSPQTTNNTQNAETNIAEK